MPKGSLRQQFSRILKPASGPFSSPSQQLTQILYFGFGALFLTTAVIVFTLFRIADQIDNLRSDLRTVLPENTDPRFKYEANVYTQLLKTKSDKTLKESGELYIHREIILLFSNEGRKPVVLDSIRLVTNTSRSDYPFNSEKSAYEMKPYSENFMILNPGENKIISIHDDIVAVLKPEIAEEVAKREPSASLPDLKAVNLQQRVHVQLGISTLGDVETACLGPFLDAWNVTKATIGFGGSLTQLPNATSQLLFQRKAADPLSFVSCEEMYKPPPHDKQD